MKQKTKKSVSLLGAFICLVGIGYLGGVFTNDAYFRNITQYEECGDFNVDAWLSDNPLSKYLIDPNDPLGIFCAQEQKEKGVKTITVKIDCPEHREQDKREYCEVEQVFDPRSTGLVALVGLLGVFVVGVRRYDR